MHRLRRQNGHRIFALTLDLRRQRQTQSHAPAARVLVMDRQFEAGRPVLRKVNLRIDQDDRIAILGPNGEGKSTLVKAISGRLAPLGGAAFCLATRSVIFAGLALSAGARSGYRRHAR